MAWYSKPKEAFEGTGAVGGAAAGALVGGVPGAIIGGVMGNNGWNLNPNQPQQPGYDIDPNAFKDPYHAENRENYAAGAAAAGARTGPTEFRTGQQELISTLQNAVKGVGPSVAESTLRAGADRNLAAARSLQASGVGASNPALAMRAIENARAGTSQQLARDAATLRAGEIAQARGELGNVLTGARGMDLQQQAMNDDLMMKYTALGYSNDQAAAAAARELEALRVQEALGTQGINANVNAQNQAWWTNAAGSALNAAGTVGAAMASDERVKKDVAPGGSEVRRFLEGIRARGFSYEKPGAPGQAPGRHVGVMAQDLEKAGPIGAGMVATGPGGTKMVDAGQAAGTALAATADLNERLKRVEGASAKPSVGRRMIDWIRGQGAPGGLGAGGKMVNAGATG